MWSCDFIWPYHRVGQCSGFEHRVGQDHLRADLFSGLSLLWSQLVGWWGIQTYCSLNHSLMRRAICISLQINPALRLPLRVTVLGLQACVYTTGPVLSSQHSAHVTPEDGLLTLEATRLQESMSLSSGDTMPRGLSHGLQGQC